MSDNQTDVHAVAPKLGVRPWSFLIGLVLGLALCSWIARVVSARGYHPDFSRFHVRISPEAQYYPTLEEMRGIVRSKCRPDQILVIVGGNSIFHGVGQPPGKIWTEELQRLLGDRFVVVNFAFRGALCFDGGAVVAESLRREFPHQIYVTNTAPFAECHPMGNATYRYLYFEARSRGLLEDYAPRDELVDYFVGREETWARRFEIVGTGWLDRILRYRDLWNFVGYRYFFTVKNPYTPSLPQAVWPRARFADEEPDFEAMPFSQRFQPRNTEVEMQITRGFSSIYYFKVWQGSWRLRPLAYLNFFTRAAVAVPDDLKSRTLVMLSRNSPYYLKNLTSDEMLRENLAYRDAAEVWRRLGYEASEYGRNFAETDFGDRTHLTATGGRKLAQIIAPQVKLMAQKLKYLP